MLKNTQKTIVLMGKEYIIPKGLPPEQQTEVNNLVNIHRTVEKMRIAANAIIKDMKRINEENENT